MQTTVTRSNDIDETLAFCQIFKFLKEIRQRKVHYIYKRRISMLLRESSCELTDANYFFHDFKACFFVTQ